MEIQEIKSRLTMVEVLEYYNLHPDRNHRLLCPFHDDKTPSLQVYPETNTCYCFSSNCATHGKSMDVIDFVKNKENTTKHEALKLCGWMAGSNGENVKEAVSRSSSAVSPVIPVSASFVSDRSKFLERMFDRFKNALSHSKPGLAYLEGRCLDYRKIEAGYNSGALHQGNQRDEETIASSLQYGLLSSTHQRGTGGAEVYRIFARNSIVFALRDKENRITGLYFRSITNNKDERHFYLKDRSGLYPGYPDKRSTHLLITESVIDAASLLTNAENALKVEGLRFSVLALYGTNGFTEEHRSAISDLSHLQELTFFLNGDEPGRKATEKYSLMLHEQYPELLITDVCVADNDDVNSLLQGHEPEILSHLINNRKEVNFFLSTEETTEKEENASRKTEHGENASCVDRSACSVLPSSFNSTNPHNITYKGAIGHYAAKGLLKNGSDSMKVALQVVHSGNGMDYRGKVDLYEYKQLQQFAQTVSGSLELLQEEIERELMQFTGLMEKYREEYRESKAERRKVTIPEATVRKCIRFLESPDLLSRLNDLIGESGIVGEENNRLFLFVTATSYKMPDTLHALIQGSSGSGKTRLLKTISRLMPPEDTKHFTRVTDNSFYNYGEYDLENKLLCFEDIDGLKEEALLALRELQSNDILISSTSQKDDNGNIRSVERIVRGPIASLSATTRGDYYEDNISRSFVLSVDESRQQTERIIQYQNNLAAGLGHGSREEHQTQFIQNCVRLLKPLKVINPYANKIDLPPQAHKIRRLNEMYQSIVKQVVVINQYQRKQDRYGRLIAEQADLVSACELLFESIVLKVDELEGNLRQFFERLKEFVIKKSQDEVKDKSEVKVNRFDIRAATGVSKTQQHRYMNQLVMLEYVRQYGFANRGFTYQIAHWDNISLLRSQIKEQLQKQIEALQTAGVPAENQVTAE